MEKAIFYVRLEFIVCAKVSKLNGWSVPGDEGIEVGSAELGKLNNEGTVEPVIYIPSTTFQKKLGWKR